MSTTDSKQAGDTYKQTGGSLAQLLQSAGRVTNVMDIPLDKIRSLKQVRTQFKKIEELADSLVVEGQQTPIIVSPINEQGVYIIQKGERRFRASQHAGLPTIKAIIQAVPKSSLDAVAGQIIENVQRYDLEPMELAYALKQFTDAGWTHERIANRLSKSRLYVTRHLTLIDMPLELKDLYQAEAVTDTQTLNLLNTLFKEDRATALALCKRASEEKGLSRGVVSEALRDVKAAKHLAKEAEEQAKRADEQAALAVEQGDVAEKDCSHDNNASLSTESETASQNPQANEPVEDITAAGEATSTQDSSAVHEVRTEDTDSQEQADKVIVAGDQELVIELSVIMENGDTEPGTLMLEAVSPAPAFAWVYLTRKKTELCIHTSRLAITKVSAS